MRIILTYNLNVMNSQFHIPLLVFLNRTDILFFRFFEVVIQISCQLLKSHFERDNYLKGATHLLNAGCRCCAVSEALTRKLFLNHNLAMPFCFH